MMRVLVVEDDENKRVPLRAFFEKDFPSFTIVEETSLIPAVNRAKSEPFDIVVLDMTLPFYSDEKSGVAGTHTFGGEEFLSQLDRRGTRTSVFIFSQFETFGEPPDVRSFSQLAEELREAYPDLYAGAVYYHASKSDWIEQLKAGIVDIVKSSES